MMDEDEADRIRASRGNYEVEVSCTEEVGLRESKRKCDKNPGHLKFIPVKDFNIEHLPSRYHDNLLVDFVRATSDVTCRLSVSRISGDRPDTYPDSDRPFPFSAFKGKNCTLTGTGWVYGVTKYPEELNSKCKCNECHKPGNTPKKTWGRVYIQTAAHVVYNSEEASHTKFQFFYDSHETDINKVPILTGLTISHIDVEKDTCFLWYVTHDMELLDRFDRMWRPWKDLCQEVINKYLSNKYPGVCIPGVGCDTNVDHDLCIIVSHPHGCSKVVTVSAWTHREEVREYKGVGSDKDMTYRYNTPTCPGSSGAPVFTLYNYSDTNYPYDPRPHSQGRPGNDNSSGGGWEVVKKP